MEQLVFASICGDYLGNCFLDARASVCLNFARARRVDANIITLAMPSFFPCFRACPISLACQNTAPMQIGDANAM